MKFVKEIAILLLAVVFLFISAGIVIYKIDCACTQKQELSMYLSPSTCEDEFHAHHTHQNQDNKQETAGHDLDKCLVHLDKCGCSSPQFEYLKLVNHFTKEETEYLKIQPFTITPVTLPLVETDFQSPEKQPAEFYIDPPPRFVSSVEFLIQINKLKIPEIA